MRFKKFYGEPHLLEFINSKIQSKKPSVSGNRFLYKNALKFTYEHLEYEKKFQGLRPLDSQGGEQFSLLNREMNR
jgi:hypothetical protein